MADPSVADLVRSFELHLRPRARPVARSRRWHAIQALLPPARHGSRPRVNDRAVLAGLCPGRANVGPSRDEDQFAAGTIWGLAHLVDQVAGGGQRSGHLVPVAKAQGGL